MIVEMREVYWARFLTEFIQNPLGTGSLVPSSSGLARMMVQQAELGSADAVLEYGPGTGIFTEYILRELRPESKFAAIEINPRFAAIFRAAYPSIPLFEDSAENVCAICESMQIASVDCVVSGLPWAFFSKSMQIMCLDQMMRVLKPGGRFVTFGYLQSLALPAGRHLSSLLPTYFTTVSRSRTVWFNLPPAFVYRCRR
jgi:phosphatidylethanolamine/phosphatidyl-N-methylethanolamine N-methyltransferase